jgi:hypothetical protein
VGAYESIQPGRVNARRAGPFPADTLLCRDRRETADGLEFTFAYRPGGWNGFRLPCGRAARAGPPPYKAFDG